MGPQQSSLPLLLLFQYRLPLRCAAFLWVVAQRHASLRGCGVTLASPKHLRVGVAFNAGVLNL
jgi:hypothetical protein